MKIKQLSTFGLTGSFQSEKQFRDCVNFDHGKPCIHISVIKVWLLFRTIRFCLYVTFPDHAFTIFFQGTRRVLYNVNILYTVYQKL